MHGKNFAANTLVRFAARKTDAKNTALCSWTEFSTYINKHTIQCKMPSYNCIMQAITKQMILPVGGIVLEVAASLNQGIEFSSTIAKIMLFNPDLMQNLILSPQFTVCFPGKPSIDRFNIRISPSAGNKHTFPESNAYSLRFSSSSDVPVRIN